MTDDKPFRDMTDPPGRPAGHQPDHTMADASSAVPSHGSLREAVALFTTEEALQKAIDDLSMAGFFPHDMSLMGQDEESLKRIASRRHVELAKTDPDTPRRAIVSPEELGNAQGVAIGVPAYIAAIAATGAIISTGGTALAAAAGAVAAGGAGGGLGAILARWLGNKRDESLRPHLEGGGMLLWVNVRDAERERQACEILRRHATGTVEVHNIAPE